MVAISASVKEGSSLNLVTPTLRSMCQGGITRAATLALMARAQGLASRYVRSDMGAMEPGRWQFWQARWKIGATSLEKVGTGCSTEAAKAAHTERTTPARADRIINPPGGIIILRTRPGVKRSCPGTRVVNELVVRCIPPAPQGFFG